MNERIRELAEQAGAMNVIGIPKDRALVGYVSIEKFAELIIEECDGGYYDQGTASRRILCSCGTEAFLGSGHELGLK